MMDSPTKFYYIGVDVGTGSARAALVDDDGNILAESTNATQTYRLESDSRIFEQSTTDIWSQIKLAITQVVAASKVDPSLIKGLGFDATCSLAVTDFNGQPIAVTPQPSSSSSEWGPGERNVILWADHRAEEEAALINSTGSKVLNYVGKTMSLEMEIPKILWLKKHMPDELFRQCMFFDLPDYLTYKATGSLARSNCSLVCKCSYVPPGVDGSELGWQPDFFEQIGLGEMVKDDFKQLGGVPGRNGIVLTAGQPVGDGLTEEIAAELGLLPGTAVGSALIDAYAGWVGTVAAPATNPFSESNNHPSLISSQNRLAAIAGTSTCYCVQSPSGILVDGVWGPYKHAVFPGLWMNEGGQSSTGQLIDFIIDTHPAAPALRTLASETNRSPFQVLHDKIDSLASDAGLSHASLLTKDLFIYPDFHGNRSPLADSTMRGSITGLRLDRSLTDLALKYYATLEAIALQTRHIVEAMNAKGHQIDSIYMSGGHVKNPVFMQLIADVCGMPVQLPFSSSASVVAGSAILGRFAADVKDPHGSGASGESAPKERTRIEDQKTAEESSFKYKDHLWDLMVRMTKPGTLVFPQKDEKLRRLLDVKYKIFRESIEIQRRWKGMVAEVTN
ncbi:Carbohydrate kinase, FGGY, C-terminal [Kalmanozyma brasiliensis GHG001]|uniref:Ribulose kinase and related carbohydrate kinase n=1 Tax=Kalmanozyma brasiliensis (strain GHG001) TaxID=1365824 RepID=V5EWP8_KALBG|nr:Carbohydrate kinase, FGGY, C-terminal [Kalmanozyma brasiliensis GHG001]EST07803.1 Carbohydrate kinase, FGGY, C-terminal [Kalmanozyma brasiliensis GHG001]